jgi:cytochrome c553
MKKSVLAAGLILAPVLAYAEVPEWAAPETTTSISAAQLKPIADADQAVRNRVFPTVPASVPVIVRQGKKNDLTGPGVCQGCHTTTGMGQPQTAPIAGLPAAYIVRELNDMANGDRKTYRADMAMFAKILSPEEKQHLADYYSSLHFSPWITVKESDTAPKVVVGGRDIVARAPGGGDEPIGNRIVELANSAESPYATPGPAYVAYVPQGSIARGEQLVTTGGGGKTVRCTGCHNANLLGKDETPAIAGRSAIYIARELYEFKDGTRGGMSATAMKRVAANLTDDDIVAIAAYLASRPPA